MEGTTEPIPEQGRQPESTGAHHPDLVGLSAHADGPQPEGLYLGCMSPEDSAAFEAAIATPNLATEIRLMRAMLSRLSENLPDTYPGIVRVFAVLIRAIGTMDKQPENAGIWEQILLAEGEARIVKEEMS